MTGTTEINRRQLKTRSRAWPTMIARWLTGAGLRPNQISVLSILFALAATLNFSAGRSAAGWEAARWLILAAFCIQLRLLCNLLDGLLAIEGGLKTKTGDLYNEIPDRIADIAILLGAGLALRDLPYGMSLAWTAAILAVLTAYVRLLGGSLRLIQDFGGPMAKQHRMFAITVGALAAAIEVVLGGTIWSLYIALVVVALGSAVTLVRRTLRVARELSNR